MEKVKPKTTIIYCTANIEKPEFEEKVKEIIKENSAGLPIISVSRLPIKFGKNICVTEKASLSKGSFLRQLLKGLKATKTDFAIITKADTLYPSEYFSFVPSVKNQVFQYKNVWALGDKFWRKDLTEAAMICGTKHWIKLVTKALKGHNNWKPFDPPPTFVSNPENTWDGETAVVSVSTPNSLRKFPYILPNSLPKIALPHWGFSKELKQDLNA
jgi:hypothetical protein